MTIRERYEHLARAESDEVYRAALLAKMARDRGFFINVACWTADPRLSSERRNLPFLLFPKQEEYVAWLGRHIDEGHDGLTEKSRDTGATWCVLAVLVHGWIFERGFTALVGSYIVDLVDRVGDKATHFWKILFLIENLPAWLKPAGWKPDKPFRTYLKIENPQNGSVITGAAASENFGRQGRYKVVFPDEFAAWEYAASAWTASGETTECRLPVSTPKGMNFFGRLANPKNADLAMDKFIIDWKDDPRHSRQEFDERLGKMIYPYYEKAKKRYQYDPTMLAQELDRDYNRSVKGRYYPQVDFVGLGRFPFDRLQPLYVAWDFGTSDETAIGWFQWHATQRRYRLIDYFQRSGQGIAFYVPFVTGFLPTNEPWEYTEAELKIIQRHSGWKVDAHFGDPAGRQRNPVTNTSVLEELQKPRPGAPNGIHVYTNTRAVRHETRRAATQKFLTQLDVDEERCTVWLDCLRNAKYPKRADSTQSTGELNKPVHDWTSHARSMTEYMAVNDPHGYDLPVDDDATDEERLARLIEREEYDTDPMLAGRGLAGY